MNYVSPSAFELAVNRVLPVPKKVKPLAGSLKLDSRFTVTAPAAPYGPVMTAGQRIRDLFAGYCGEREVKVTLSIAPAPTDTRCTAEGYSLTVTADVIDITGYGEKGLLYGVITLEQLCKNQTQVPAMQITDWPDCPTRGIKEESRYGSNLMERSDWMALLEDVVSKKMNTLVLSFYGCWMVQYDGKVSEFLYMPVKNHPQLQTPMTIKYFSPAENRWIQQETLPPHFPG